MDYKLVRSRRKTLCICFGSGGELVVRAPLRAAVADINRFVAAHDAWIRKHAPVVQRNADAARSLTFENGQILYFAGRPLVIVDGEKPRVLANTIELPPESRKEGYDALCRAYAREQAAVALERFGPVLGVRAATLKITSARTRWGSCSADAGICISLRCAMLSPHLLDYIAVHELAHIRERNHSRRFYDVVAIALPEHEALRRELTSAGRQMLAYGL